jgi:hypothetical protein
MAQIPAPEPTPQPAHVQSKFEEIITSKKFWATVASLAAIWTSYAMHAIDANAAVQGTIGAIGAYVVAVGIEDNGKAQA